MYQDRCKGPSTAVAIAVAVFAAAFAVVPLLHTSLKQFQRDSVSDFFNRVSNRSMPAICRGCGTLQENFFGQYDFEAIQSTDAIKLTNVNIISDQSRKKSIDNDLFWYRDTKMPLAFGTRDGHIDRGVTLSLTSFLATGLLGQGTSSSSTQSTSTLAYYNAYLRELPQNVAEEIERATEWLRGSNATTDGAGFHRVACPEVSADHLSSNVWISSPGVEVQAHYDTVENVLVQLAGSKTVTLAPPNSTENGLEPFPFLHVHSR